MTDITLHIGNKKYSSWSLRPWLALKHTGAPFAEVLIPLDQPETKSAIGRSSPSGRVPVLRHGDVIVWESLAICEHLAEVFPAARLWPQDPVARAHARAVSSEMHAGFTDLRRHLPMDLGRRWPLGDRLVRAEADIARVCAIWRECREHFGKRGVNDAGDFLFGGFTIADAMYAPVTTRFLTYGVPLDPVCAAYVEAMSRWPAMREWAEAARAEPWVIHYDANSEEPSRGDSRG
jgi:glutathione S-transferase